MGDSENSYASKLYRLSTPDQEILSAIVAYAGLEAIDEAQSIYTEAQKGNEVAQFIVGMALLRTKREETAEIWLELSAAQGFEPAIQHRKKAG